MRVGMRRQGTLARVSRPRFKFVGDTVAELRKVVWPSWPEARNLTAIVIIVSIAVGLILGIVDQGFSWLITEVLLKP